MLHKSPICASSGPSGEGTLSPLQHILGGRFPEEEGVIWGRFSPCIGDPKSWSETKVIDPLGKCRASLHACLLCSMPFCEHWKTFMGKFSSCYSLRYLTQRKMFQGNYMVLYTLITESLKFRVGRGLGNISPKCFMGTHGDTGALGGEVI